MKLKPNGKTFLAAVFVTCISIGGILTFVTNPVQVMGGLARGYISAPAESGFWGRMQNSFSTFNKRMNEYFAFHDVSIHAYGYVQKALGRTLIHDVDKSSEVIKLNNGYLTFKQSSNIDYHALKDYLLNLKLVCDSQGSHLIHVLNLNKNTSDSELLPASYPYIYASTFEDAISILETNGVPVLDYRKLISQQNIDAYSLFFKTDHHWKPRSGLWAAQEICKTINTHYQFNLDSSLLDISNFSTQIFPSSFLGSEGKRVGALYAGVDDFEVVTPAFPTCLTVKMDDIRFEATGSFSETMIFEDNITPNNLLNKKTTAYCTYMQGNHALVEIQNHDLPEGKSALLIMDSYGCVVAPYLALTFQELNCIDIRSYSDSIEEYIKTTSPDVVIYAINYFQ